MFAGCRIPATRGERDMIPDFNDDASLHGALRLAFKANPLPF
jgi:hypothetical protein